MTKIYVGNLPFSADEAAVRQLFEQHGKVDSVALINDRETGRSKGFGFVEMDNEEEGRKAIASLNESEVQGRKLIVNEARPQEPRSGGGGGGFKKRFGGGGGGYGASRREGGGDGSFRSPYGNGPRGGQRGDDRLARTHIALQQAVQRLGDGVALLTARPEAMRAWLGLRDPGPAQELVASLQPDGRALQLDALLQLRDPLAPLAAADGPRLLQALKAPAAPQPRGVLAPSGCRSAQRSTCGYSCTAKNSAA